MSEALENKGESLEDLQAKVKTLHTEAAKYRTERNTAVKRLTALETIVKEHKISTSSVDELLLSSYEIVDGKVSNPDIFTYKPPELSKQEVLSKLSDKVDHTPANTGSEKKQLGDADLENMSVDEINAAYESGRFSDMLTQ